MERELKLYLGKLLGEQYRMMKRIPDKACKVPVEDDIIYGLLNGIDEAIDKAFGCEGGVTKEELEAMDNVLTPIEITPERVAKFKGYYDIEDELERLGIDREKARVMLTYRAAGDQYTRVLRAMDSSNSPDELRRFPLKETDV